jgi:hypothetical protein
MIDAKLQICKNSLEFQCQMMRNYMKSMVGQLANKIEYN